MNDAAQILESVRKGDKAALARCISLVENESGEYENILSSLRFDAAVPVIGFTGPPGAGKSTLINSLIRHLREQKKKIAVLAVDPTSPFTRGALLGDRVRMSEHEVHEEVFIRSLATRGSLGGLSGKTIEVTDVMKEAGFDYIFVETVGVGQSEVEIASLADTTVLVLVPGAGDEIQLLKSGILEIADIFVVNKSDRGEADSLVKKLNDMVHARTASDEWMSPVLKTSASNNEGMKELTEQIDLHLKNNSGNKKQRLLAERAFRLLSEQKMKGVDKESFSKKLIREMLVPGFNLYSFIRLEARK